MYTSKLGAEFTKVCAERLRSLYLELLDVAESSGEGVGKATLSAPAFKGYLEGDRAPKSGEKGTATPAPAQKRKAKRETGSEDHARSPLPRRVKSPITRRKSEGGGARVVAEAEPDAGDESAAHPPKSLPGILRPPGARMPPDGAEDKAAVWLSASDLTLKEADKLTHMVVEGQFWEALSRGRGSDRSGNQPWRSQLEGGHWHSDRGCVEGASRASQRDAPPVRETDMEREFDPCRTTSATGGCRLRVGQQPRSRSRQFEKSRRGGFVEESSEGGRGGRSRHSSRQILSRGAGGRGRGRSKELQPRAKQPSRGRKRRSSRCWKPP